MEFFAIVLTAAFCAALLFAPETPASIAKSELPSLFAIYKDMHQHPERSTHEQRTSELVAKQLEAATDWLCSCAPTWDGPSEREESGLLCGPRARLQKSVALTPQALVC